MILGVGTAPQIAGAWPDLPEHDLGAAVLLPGFVDAHCHLEWSLADPVDGAPGFAAWLGTILELGNAMTSEDFAAAAQLGALHCLRHGTTTVADSGPTGAGAAALRATGLRGIVHLETFGRHTGPGARDAAAAFAERVVALQDSHGDDRVRIGVSPHAPYTVGPEYWTALLEHPDLRDRSWATHLAESPDETALLTSGDGPLAALFAARGTIPGVWPGSGSPVAKLARAGALRTGLIAAHCVQLDADDPSRLAGAGVGVAHCPISNHALGCGTAPIRRLREFGVAVGLGTDSPASAGEYDVRADGRAAETAGGLSAAEILELATLGGARVLGLDHEIGSLEVGKRADVVAVSCLDVETDPCAAALAPGASVHFVMVDGNVLVDGGRLTAVDPAPIVARAAASRARRSG